ncbi:unnamed protein product [Paramecium primaurelia]|uniref:Ubiquitin-like protease family profile domain-containing protein n=1 Tax=Paramecium primaurelia TaxID=5886 RepID=A0A8S1LTG0_PARPR|nr:unnamed protein product [Paramecium primaurelia]
MIKPKKKQQQNKMEQLIQNKRQEHLELLNQLEKLEIQQSTKEMQIIQTITQQQKKEHDIEIIAAPQLVSPKWLMNLKPNMTYECDVVTQEESELDQIVKHQLKEKIQKQKEMQQQAYLELINELDLQSKHHAYDEKVKEDFKCTYQYMSQGRLVSIDIKYYDFLKLNPQNYVNDTIINFFLRFIENDIFKNKSLFIYNTYFCTRLLSFHAEYKQIYTQYLQNNQMLQRWTKDNIFMKQYILFPLHLREHWAVIFVVNPLQVCEQLCNNNYQLSTDVNKNGYLIYFDSLLIQDQRIGIQIKFYLMHVYNLEHKRYSDDQIYEIVMRSTVPVHQPIVPRQTNLVDCGLYMLEYVERFLMNPYQILNNLEQDHLKWFPKVMIFIKRILIKKILNALSSGQKDYAIRYQENCRMIDQQFTDSNQYDYIDEQLLEQLQVPRLQFHLSEDYNYYYDVSPSVGV